MRSHALAMFICLSFAASALGIGVAAHLTTSADAESPLGPELTASEDQAPISPIPQPPPADPQKLLLGERLFGDTRLSANGDLSCQSCHDIKTNGAVDAAHRGSPCATGPSSAGLNTLTVFNAALSFRLGWQGNFRSLAAQAEASIESPHGMHSSAGDVVRKLNADPDMVRRFEAAYGHEPDRDSLLDALVTFERSLLTPDSRFDHWLKGDKSALTTEEHDGYRLFKSYGCISCHQGVNIGGNLFQRQGVFKPLVKTGPQVVRVPSLRNVATTAPYFHDGSAATLEQAVARMAVAQLDRTLTDQQIALIVAFLKTLTGNYRGSPVASGAQP
ncbi:Cytochrome c551 peroxidase precursor (Cytochrome c peroxidase) [Bradyrhizobium sp. STM 3843]|uniref:cytochrome-c peroxidase n=1 Tax=Bradyrhizobium sp. STM 3843 TaxID=551947 RepID=UPI0002404A13|nr:cytochrome c peroxidase [Bradyrhizobium sp. STM 3843]CCE11710.1 Cytochrome c551 peroxidase precursor (Cytochrome c peroxidase) [Bradyrhizobium sp. STM 3843]